MSTQSFFSSTPQIPQIKPHHSAGKSSLRWLFLIVVVIGLLLVLNKSLRFNAAPAPQSAVEDKVTVKTPRKHTQLDKEFKFPIRDKTGKDINKTITFTLEKAELTDELIIQGKKAAAVAGRTFLVLTIKLNNSENINIDINTRDYVRLTFPDSTDRLAADIHSDPVTVQPISTKYTRLGFPVDVEKSKYILYVGEISGNKESLEINL